MLTPEFDVLLSEQGCRNDLPAGISAAARQPPFALTICAKTSSTGRSAESSGRLRYWSACHSVCQEGRRYRVQLEDLETQQRLVGPWV